MPELTYTIDNEGVRGEGFEAYGNMLADHAWGMPADLDDYFSRRFADYSVVNDSAADQGVIKGEAVTQHEMYNYALRENAVLGTSLYANIVLAGFTILAIAFWARNLSDPRTKIITVSIMMVSVVSISSYTGLASGLTMSVLEMPEGHLADENVVENVAGSNQYIDATGVVTMWGRYLTWALSTPFILLAIGLIAGSNITKIFTAIVFDIAMCVTGLAAALTVSAHWMRWWWYLLSCAFFIVVLYILLVEWPRDAEAAGTLDIFRTLQLLTVVGWLGYPVVWALGSEGVAFLNVGQTSWLYSGLDIITKYALALILINYVVDEPETVTAGGDYGASLPGVSPGDDD